MGRAAELALLSSLLIVFLATDLSEAKKDCYASVGGSLGHVYQFDGGYLVIDPVARGCRKPLLLTKSHSGFCKFAIHATFNSVKRDADKKLARLSGIAVNVDGHKYELLTGRRLIVNGHPKPPPYETDAGIRVFYSGEDLVLVHRRCHFWVTFDGHWTATLRLGSRYYGKHVDGLAGNCNGRRDGDDDSSVWSRWLVDAKCKKPHAYQHHRGTCESRSQKAAALRACRRVINGRGGCTNLEVLQTCVADFCATRKGEDSLRSRIVCASFYLHSRRCARNNRPLAAWRHMSGCALQCSANAHFVPKANPCPETCGSHFFGTPKRCFHLPSAEGCRCKSGFVLDHNRCVRPRECRCLVKVCADRMPRQKCLRWRHQGRCHKYPALMASFCRVTCGMCRLRCRNQFSAKLCASIKAKGKCHKAFYKAACPLTCDSEKCHCPASRKVVSKCSPRYKNRVVTQFHWFRDHSGKCLKSVLVHYEPCGYCPPIEKTIVTPCNYCTGLRAGKRIEQRREAHGYHRCFKRVHTFQKKCGCPTKVVRRSSCERDTVTVSAIKIFTATRDCKGCGWFKRRKILKKINCTNKRTDLPKCKPNHKYRIRRVYHQFAKHCSCHWRLVSETRLLCRCQQPHSKTFCSSEGDHLVTVTLHWRLIHSENRCAKQVKRVKRHLICSNKRHVKVTCNRHSCLATRHRTWHSLRSCKCLRRSDKKVLGKCCCPPSYKKTVHVDKYWKKHIHVVFRLVHHKCKKHVTVRKIRIACPKPTSSSKCDGHEGAHVFTKVWFELKDNCCVKKRLRRLVKIACRRGVTRRTGPCDIRQGAARFRKIYFAFSRRRPGTCRCVRIRRTVKEFCGCLKGKFLTVKPCPKAGCNKDSCDSECHFTKTYYYYAKKFGQHRCHKKVFKQVRFPCCCPENKRVKHWCHADKFKMQQVSFTVLKPDSHECHRVRKTTSTRVQCLHEPGYTETKKLAHSNPHKYYLATYRWHLVNCHCKVTVSKRVCLKRCKPKRSHRFCDHLTRAWVTRKITWHLKGCHTCVKKVSEVRRPVRCSKMVTRTKHCDKISGVLTLTASRLKPKDCGCVRVKRVRRLRCKCPKPIVGKPHCSHKQHAFVKRTVYWILRRGHCVKRRKTRSVYVKCSKTVIYRKVCKHKTGVLTVYIGVMQIDGCRCHRVWSLHNKHRCNCKKENLRAKHEVRHYCDRHRNLKAIVRPYYVLRNHCCVRRSIVRRRDYSCPPAYVEKKRCNLHRRQQVTLKHYSVKRNCQCVRAVKRWARKCGCPGPKVSHKQFCRKVLGVIVSVKSTRKWSHSKERCIHRSVTRSHRVVCSQKSHISDSKCFKNKFYVETKIFFERKGCHCVKRVVKRKRNCHCKTIVRRFKCPPAKSGRYTRRIVTQILRWHAATKRCKTARFVTRRVRCRCPSPRHRKFCHAGAWIDETTKFVLRHKQCYERVIRHQNRVHCDGDIRHRYTACHGCKERHVYTLERRLDAKRCACYFAVVKRHSCPCCCPKPVVKKHCSPTRHAWVKTVVSHSVLNGKRCGCKRHVRHHERRVICPKNSVYSWLPCDRHACVQKQQVEFSENYKCGCRRVRKFTGKHRVCCCHGKTKRAQFCKGSAIHERVITVHLQDWKCVRRKRVFLVHKWKCSPNPKVVIQKCNRTNCRQALHTLVRKVDHPHCRCHRVPVDHRSRPCCCLKRPYSRHFCDAASSAWVTVKVAFGFDYHLRVCVKRRREIRSPVRCPQNSRRTLACNRHTCRRPILHIAFSCKNCRCRRRVTKTSKLCCCPPPEKIPARCVHSHHEWLHGLVTWHLRKDRCVKRVTTVRRRVTCTHRATRRVLACNRKTCRQTIRHKTWHLKGCRCVVVQSDKQRTCCCRPAKRSKTRCEHDTDFVKYTTIRYLDKSTYECRNKHEKRLLHRLQNCKGEERWGKCNHKTRHRTVKLVLRKANHCHCRVYRRSTRRVLCSCPPPFKKRSKCNRDSCHRTITKVWFTSHGKRDQFHCRKHRRVIRLRCCCKKNPGSRVFCDSHTGSIRRKDWWTVFVINFGCCERRQRIVTIKPLSCPSTVCHLSKCSKATGYKERVCKSSKPVRHSCSCLRRVSRRRIICHCPASYSRKFCKHDSSIVYVHTSWKLSLSQNRCVKVVRRVIKQLVCSHRRWRVKKCHSRKKGCGGTWFYHKYRIRNCKCQLLTRTKPIKCCCPKSSRVKSCLGDQWLTVRTRYKLRSGHCIKLVSRRLHSIPCNRRLVSTSGCAPDCKKRRLTRCYSVKNCKCTLVKRRLQVKKCCCPPPKRYKQCDSKNGLFNRIKVYWRLVHGKCLKRRRVVSKKLICVGGWIRVGKCNRVTRYQKVKQLKRFRVGCRCRSVIRVQKYLCRCRMPLVVKEKCKHKMLKRRVFRITFRLSHPGSKLAKCIKQRRLWYTEPCRCPKPTHQRRCSNSGSAIVTCIKTWHMRVVKRRGHKQRLCIRKTTIRHRLVLCPAREVRWSKCHGCQKRRTVAWFRLRSCKCQKVVKVQLFACNCEKKSFKRTHCDAKSGHIVRTIHSCFSPHDAEKCSCRTRHRYQPILCHRNQRKFLLSKTPCGLHRNHACFSRYAITWRVRHGCKCVRRRRTVTKFCRCHPGRRRVKCALNGRTIVKIHDFFHPFSKHHHVKGCRHVRRVTKHAVLCDSEKPQISTGGCSAHCNRSIVVKQCLVKHCRRVKCVKSALQLCCNPPPSKKHFCDKKLGRWVFETVTHKLATSVPLLKDCHGRIVAHQLKVTSKTHRAFRSIICPRNTVSETCDRHSGLWRKHRTTWRRVDCHCRRRITISRGKCKCPPKRIHWGPCVHRHRVKTVTWFVLRNHACKRHVRRRSFLCACPKPRQYTVCDRCGAWKTCHISFKLLFREQRCKKLRKCRRLQHTCPVSVETRGKCIDCKRQIRHVSWHLNRQKCSCTRRIRRRVAECDCWKKKSRATACIHGAFVTKIVTHRQRGEKCVKFVKTISKPVYCSHSRVKRVVPNSCVQTPHHPHSGYKKLVTEWHVRHGCKCIRKRRYTLCPCVCRLIKKYRTQKSVKCHGCAFVHTKVYFVLSHKKGHKCKCVKQVQKHRKNIVCKGTKTHRSPCKPNKHGDTHSTVRVWHRQCNGQCGCVWRLASAKSFVCRCRPSHHLKICHHDHIWRKVHVSYHPVHGSLTCRARRRTQDQHLMCPVPFIRKTKCHKCGFAVKKYAYEFKKCRCVAKLASSRHLRCCCPPPVVAHHCDAKRHLFVTTTISHILRNHQCHKRRVARSRRIHCGERDAPLYRVSKCHKNWRKISKTVRFIVGCKCQVRITHYKQRCDCPHQLVFRKGKCGHRYAHDIWLGWRLKDTGIKIPGTNKNKFICVRVVVERRKRRCRCPKPYHRISCRTDDRWLKINVSYRLHGNGCQRKRVVTERRIPCQKKKHLVKTIVTPSKCLAKYGYKQTIKRVYVHANHCRCIKTVKAHHRVCNCLLKHGGKKHSVRCHSPNKLVKTITWFAKRNHHCVKRVKTSTKVLHCEKKRRIRATHCHPTKGVRHFSFYHLTIKHCKCVWRLVKRLKAPCKCPETKLVKRCHKDRWVTTKVGWHLVGKDWKAHCVQWRKRIVHRIPCRGAGKRLVTSSGCNYFGYRTTKISFAWLSQCKCMRRVEYSKCRCRCPKDRVRKFCHSQAWVTVRLQHHIKKCACVASRRESRSPVPCPKPTFVRGACLRAHNGDKYRELVWTSWHGSKCRCKKIRKIQRQLCACDRRPRTSKSCVASYLHVALKTERRLIHGHCRRVRTRRQTVTIRCERPSVKRVCDKKSGKLSIFVIKPYTKKCKCFRRVTKHSRRCGCHKGHKLTHTGKCNRYSCRQRLYFKKQVLDHVNEACIWKRYHRHRVCCCHGDRTTKKCVHKLGYHVITRKRMILKHWQCVKRVTNRVQVVKCPRQPTHHSRRLPDGVLKVVDCWKVRRGCDCVKRCRTVWRRYRCKKPSKRVRCQCSHAQCRVVTCLTHWVLSEGRCLRQTRKLVKPLFCPSGNNVWSQCNLPTKYGFYMTKLKTSWYQKACRCHKRSHLTRVVCRCWKPRSQTFCDKGQGAIVTIKVRFLYKQGHCVKSVSKKSRRIICGHHDWRFTHRTASEGKHGLYFKVFTRWVRQGCKCHKLHKKVPCKDRCPPCKRSKRCSSSGNAIVHLKTSWRLSGCHCIRRVTTRRQVLECPKSTQHSRCDHDTCLVATVIKSYHLQACRCLATQTVSRKRKCCCPKPEKSRKCVHGGVIVTRIVKHNLFDGRCFANANESHRQVTCPRSKHHTISGPCKHGKQRYSIHYWARRGCKCVRRVKRHVRKCACEYKFVKLVIAVDLHAEKGGKDRKHYGGGVVKFIDALIKHFKFGATKVHTTLLAYNSAVKFHKASHHKAIALEKFTNGRTDLHAALKAVYASLVNCEQRHKSERVKKIVLIVTRGSHHSRRRCIALAEKIQRKARVFVIGFGSLPESGSYVKWLASRPTKLHYMQLGVHGKYGFSTTRIFEHACKKHRCPRPRRFVGACRRETCQREVKLTSWYKNYGTGKCRKQVRVHSVACCCLGSDSNRLVCHAGCLKRIIVHHEFDHHHKVCRRRVWKIDTSAGVYARCQPAKRTIKGECDSDGWCRDKLVTRWVDSATCRCRERRSHLPRVRCRCPSGRKWRKCSKNHHVECSVSYHLSKHAVNGCAERRKCRRQRVVCPDGSQSHSLRGKCNHATCKRRLGHVSYTIEHCKCRRRVKTWSKVCCCKQPTTRRNYCDKSGSSRIHTTVRYRLIDGACRRVVQRVVNPVPCPKKGHLKLGHHCYPHGHGFYRKVFWVDWYLDACHCKRKTTHHGWRLCHCQKLSRKTVKCLAGRGIVKTTKHWLVAHDNHCVWRSRVVSRVTITCDAHKRVHVGSCSHRAHDGRKYLIVTDKWQQRNGCKCRNLSRSHKQLCACPKGVRRVSRCHSGRLIEVSLFHYQLKNHGSKRSECVLIRRVRRVPVTCKLPHITYGKKCLHGKRHIAVTAYSPLKCHCQAKVYRRIVSCKPGCRNVLPKRVCEKWADSERIDLCNSNRHIALKVCAKTCKLCCKHSTIVFAGHRCLSEHRDHIKKKLILSSQASTFYSCSTACQRNPLCRSFDYHAHSKSCQLLRVTPDDLKHLAPIETPGCLLFVKSCAPDLHHSCPFRRVVKSHRCQCRHIFGKTHSPICYRRSIVAVYRSHHNHRRGYKCQRHLVNVRLPCKWCDNSRSWCSSAASQGKCSTSAKVRHACPHSCQLCKRHHARNLQRRRIGLCNAKSGWQHVASGGLLYDQNIQLWRVRVQMTRRRCVSCQVGYYLKVSRCSAAGKRHLVTVHYVKKRDGKCKVSRKVKTVNCNSCGAFDIDRVAGQCRPSKHGGWQRKVVIRYTVREPHKCVVHRHTNVFGCSPKCPKKRIISESRCVCGKQVVCTRYFVTFPGAGKEAHRCVPKEFRRTRGCVGGYGAACSDKLSQADCSSIKHKGLCASLHTVCSKTCGACK